MSIIAIHQTSKPHEFAREINKLRDGIERDSKLAGQYLATLKAGRPLGLTWEHYLKDCGVKISWQYADKLIAATKPKSPEKSTDEPRQKREPPVENKAEFEEDPDQEDDPGRPDPEVVCKRILDYADQNEHISRVFRRLCRQVRFDDAQRAEIDAAIGRLILKLERVRSTLNRNAAAANGAAT